MITLAIFERQHWKCLSFPCFASHLSSQFLLCHKSKLCQGHLTTWWIARLVNPLQWRIFNRTRVQWDVMWRVSVQFVSPCKGLNLLDYLMTVWNYLLYLWTIFNSSWDLTSFTDSWTLGFSSGTWKLFIFGSHLWSSILKCSHYYNLIHTFVANKLELNMSFECAITNRALVTEPIIV